MPGFIFPALYSLRVSTISFHASASANAASVTMPATIQAGDFALLHDRSLGASPPTEVIPTDFTSILSVTGAVSRHVFSYKILDGSEASSSITGMDDTDDYKNLLIFRGDVPVRFVSIVDVESEITDGDPASQTISSASGNVPLVAVAGYGGYDNNAVTFTPAADGAIAISPHQVRTDYKIYNSSPADITADMADEGTNNGLFSFYVEFR